MSITDTDDNTKTKAFAGPNQPTSNTDTEETKKTASKSSTLPFSNTPKTAGSFDAMLAQKYKSGTNDETKISADDQKYFGCDENGKVPSEESQSDPSPMKVYELPSLPPALPGNEQEGYSGLGGAYALSNSMLARQYNPNAYGGIPFLQHQFDGGKYKI